MSNHNNANSIQAVVATIIKVRMNGMFYILAKKKFIFFLLIPKKKRSFHTSKKKTSPSYVTIEIDTVPVTDTASTGTKNVVPKMKSGSNGGTDLDCVHNTECDHMNNKDHTVKPLSYEVDNVYTKSSLDLPSNV